MDNDKAKNRITPQVVAQFHHRLLTLEVELKEQARDESIGERDFARRLSRLRGIQSKLRGLQPDRKTADGFATDLGLPQIDRCGPQELQVCDAYMQQRHRELLSVHRMLSNIAKWVEDAAMGRSGFLAVIRRLSQLRKHIGKCEHMIDAQNDEARWVDRYADDTLDKIGFQGDSLSSNTLESLITTFDNMDRTISRVATLRAKQKKLKNDVQIKEVWLKEQESVVAHYRPAFAPPLPTALWSIRHRDRQLSLLDDINSRRVKVQRFWDSVLDDKDIRKPARSRTSLTTKRETAK